MSSSIAIECNRCGHARVVTSEQVRRGSWKSVPCPACHGQTGLLPLECDDGHISLATADAIVSGDVPACPVCGPEPRVRGPDAALYLPAQSHEDRDTLQKGMTE